RGPHRCRGDRHLVGVQVAVLRVRGGLEHLRELYALVLDPVRLIDLVVRGRQHDALVTVDDFGVLHLIALDELVDLRDVGFLCLGAGPDVEHAERDDESDEDGQDPYPRAAEKALQIHVSGPLTGPSLLTRLPTPEEFPKQDLSDTCSLRSRRDNRRYTALRGVSTLLGSQ